MSYREALIAAGANVLAFESFGDWQGSWVALVEYRGERGWVQGSFGSCDHCDAFQAEFGWDWIDDEPDNYQQRLASFGKSYLGGLQTTEQVIADHEAHTSWDDEADQIIFWVRETAVRYGVIEFEQMVEKGTKAWADTPDDWVDELRGGAEKP